jgi:tRNA pseudouridine55 synthase
MPRSWGLLLLDKPSGPTSHDMVYAVRRGAGEKRVGHAGTLDPLASGLLVMCLGPATRLSEFLAGKDKRYQARIRLGTTTDTYDSQGQVQAVSDQPLPEKAAVEAALAEFRGPQQQVPPAYSAIKQGGQKSYDLARRGEAVELAPRPVEFYSIELRDWQPPELTLEAHCSAGTYIRSLAHDLGQRLGCGAHLSGLRRTASGSLRLEEAVTLADLQSAFARGDWRKYLRPADEAVADWPAVRLTDASVADVRQGRPVRFGAAETNGALEGFGRAYNPAGEFFAILRADPAAGVWRPDKVFGDH